MDKKEERKEAEKIEAERMSVEALKNTFADIKSVEFEKSRYNVMTGYYGMNVKMTNIKGECVSFGFMFAPNHPDEIDGWGVIDKKEERKEAEKIEAERMSVEALKNTFADIKSVEFEKSRYNVMTGYYGMNVKMTNIKGECVSFGFMFAPNHPDEIDGWGVKD